MEGQDRTLTNEAQTSSGKTPTGQMNGNATLKIATVAIIGLVVVLFIELSNPTIMRAVVTLTVLCAALHTIRKDNRDSPAHRWAFGVIGTILGYYLRG